MIIQSNCEEGKYKIVQLNADVVAAGAPNNIVYNAENLGAGLTIFSGQTGHTLFFKTLVAGDNVTLSGGTNEISISATGSITGATNGLTKDGKNIKLGGSLSENTSINLGSNRIFTISGTSSGFGNDYQSVLQIKTTSTGGRSIALTNSAVEGTPFVAEVKLSAANSSIGSSNTNTSESTILSNSTTQTIWRYQNTGGTASIQLSSSGGILTNNLDGSGFKYGDNYSTGFIKHSLVDKNYVTGITSTLPTNLAANKQIAVSNGTNFTGYSSLTYEPGFKSLIIDGLRIGSWGTDNIFMGEGSLPFGVTGQKNIAIGSFAGSSISTNSWNTFIGSAVALASIGNSNTIIGNQTAQALTTGNGNVIIGAASASNLASGTDNVMIGYNRNFPLSTGNGQLVIHNAIFGVNNTGSGTNISSQGRIGIFVNTPTAKLHVIGGGAGANTAPLKINSGSLNSAPEAGAIENDGTHLYYTDNSNNRLQLDERIHTTNVAYRTTSGGGIALNLLNRAQKRFIITGSTSGDTNFVFVNNTVAQIFTVDLSASTTTNILFVEDDVRVQQYEVDNSRWDSGDKELTLVGGLYTLTFSNDGSIYRLNVSDRYV